MTRIALSAIVVLFVFTSCTKFNAGEYFKNPGQLRFCNLATWKEAPADASGDTRINMFTYDANGNPTKVTSNQHGTGRGFHYFTYDSQQRLSTYEYEFAYTKTYHYEDDRKLADSATLTDVYGREFSEVYTYDVKNRIIKSVLKLVASPFEEDEYTTDVRDYVYLNDDLSSITLNGNQLNPDVVYSNDPSIYMTNKVWKFVNQNYSRHAVAGVITKNKLGLPLTIEKEDYQFPFLDINGAGATISYECE